MAPAFYDSLQFLLPSLPSPWRAIKALAATVAVASTSSSPFPGNTTTYGELAVPVFEIKIGVTPAALVGGVPGPELVDAFSLDMNSLPRSYSFYDTDDPHHLRSEGWAIRLRHKDNRKFELLYKRRFEIKPDNEEGGGLTAALQEAHDAGFDADDTHYQSEVDWMYTKRVLSFQFKRRHRAKHYRGTKMPNEATGRRWLLDQMPHRIRDLHARQVLKHSREHGPVTSNVYSGTWCDTEVKIEVLPIRAANGNGTETVVELSLASDNEGEATTLRAKAIAKLDAAGWLVKDDILKTPMVLDRY